MRYPLSAMAAAGMLALGACESPPEHAGNTIDIYNDIAKTYPNGANVNVSYRLEFLDKIERSTGRDSPDTVYLFADAGRERPDRFLQVRVTLHPSGPVPEDVTRVRLGWRRYLTRVDCVTAASADLPAPMRPFLEDLGDRAPAPNAELFVRIFVPEQPEPDGREIQVLFIQDLSGTDLTCAAIGDPARPSAETAAAVDEIKAYARRSFEILG